MKGKVEKEAIGSNTESTIAGSVEITYYTDPLCCWSWGMEPQWRRLRYEFGAGIHWRYCMAGLIPSWKSFHDSVNAVSRPAQMGPLWMEATHLTGMPIRNTIWMTDPPASSYLSCIAVKCAELQSPKAAESYLRRLRESVMLEGKNIGLHTVLLQIAQDLTKEYPAIFHQEQFRKDLENGKGKTAFAADLKEVQSLQITRFPTLIFRRIGYSPLILSGYRTYGVLLEIMKQIAPDLKRKVSIDAEEYKSYWGFMVNREMEEISAL